MNHSAQADDAKGMTDERCPCGYPMPCSTRVPITFCRAPLRDFAPALHPDGGNPR
jgi:hypothetical protein